MSQKFVYVISFVAIAVRDVSESFIAVGLLLLPNEEKIKMKRIFVSSTYDAIVRYKRNESK